MCVAITKREVHPKNKKGEKGEEDETKGIGNNLKRNRRRCLFYSGQWSAENRNKKRRKEAQNASMVDSGK